MALLCTSDPAPDMSPVKGVYYIFKYSDQQKIYFNDGSDMVFSGKFLRRQTNFYDEDDEKTLEGDFYIFSDIYLVDGGGTLHPTEQDYIDDAIHMYEDYGHSQQESGFNISDIHKDFFQPLYEQKTPSLDFLFMPKLRY